MAENKIRERYHRLWALVADAIQRCEQTTVYDNSAIKGPRIVAQMTEGYCRRLPHLATVDTQSADRALAELVDHQVWRLRCDALAHNRFSNWPRLAAMGSRKRTTGWLSNCDKWQKVTPPGNPSTPTPLSHR